MGELNLPSKNRSHRSFGVVAVVLALARGPLLSRAWLFGSDRESDANVISPTQRAVG